MTSAWSAEGIKLLSLCHVMQQLNAKGVGAVRSAGITAQSPVLTPSWEKLAQKPATPVWHPTSTSKLLEKKLQSSVLKKSWHTFLKVCQWLTRFSLVWHQSLSACFVGCHWEAFLSLSCVHCLYRELLLAREDFIETIEQRSLHLLTKALSQNLKM